jgi:uncharacterized protein
MQELILDKLENLRKILKDMKSVVIAYSGGVDSTFLLKVAKDILGDKVLTITATSSTYPKSELKETKSFTKKIGVKHIIIHSNEMKNKNFTENTPNRCYYCKIELFSKIKEIAKENQIINVIEATNFDDLNDYRPGIKALEKLDIRSPLIESKLTKEEIRSLSKEMNLETWDKLALACLASRIPYGCEITEEKLNQIEKAESVLKKVGINQVRVRHHNQIARIEINKSEFPLLLKNSNKVIDEFKNLGFTYITLDLEGYRIGSLNEMINK